MRNDRIRWESQFDRVIFYIYSFSFYLEFLSASFLIYFLKDKSIDISLAFYSLSVGKFSMRMLPASAMHTLACYAPKRNPTRLVACVSHIRCSRTARRNSFLYLPWKLVPTLAGGMLSRDAIDRSRGTKGGQSELEIRGNVCPYRSRYIFNCSTRDSITRGFFRDARLISRAISAKMHTRRSY